MPLPASQLPQTALVPMQHAAVPAFPNGSLRAGQYTLAFRIRRIRDMVLLHEHKLVLMPQRFTQTTEARTAVYYTQGGPVADTPATVGIGMTYFQLTGHTSFGGVRAGGTTPATGTPESFLQTVQG